MSVSVSVDPVSVTGDDPNDQRKEPNRRTRLMVIACAVASVVPFFWAAIRDARGGFYPTLDVAATVLRSRATLSMHPPLIGMWSSGSGWAGHEIHFPGATQLYLLAVPVHVLGNTWGTLLTMAAINAGWVLLAGWLIYRRLGANGALVGFLFISLFLWSIGSENLIDPRPMEMVTIPFFCFLFAVWAVTSDDIDVIPALAVVANYLYLNHLVLALQVPVIGLCGVAGIILWIRTARSDGDGFGKLRRRLLQGGAITLVMWLPSIYQEIRGNPGNITLLVRATGHGRDPVGSVAAGYNATIRLITDPWFWFRGRFEDPSFPRSIYHVGVGDVVGGVVLTMLIGLLGFAAWRRRDRLGLAALAVSLIGILVSIETVKQAPAQWGFPVQYLRSLWGVAAFVWFAIALNIYRTLKPSIQLRAATACGVAALLFAVLAIPYADYGSAVDMQHSRLARAYVAQALPKLTGRGRVFVTSAPDFDSQRFFSALLLALDTAGVHYCVSNRTAQQYGPEHACWADSNVFVHVSVGEVLAPDNFGEMLVRLPLLTDEETKNLDKAQLVEFRRAAKARERAVEYLASHKSIALDDKTRKLLEEKYPAQFPALERLLAPVDGNLFRTAKSELFGLLVATASAPANGLKVFADPDFPLEDMEEYIGLGRIGPTKQDYVFLVEHEGH